jgi:hypothetical protein
MVLAVKMFVPKFERSKTHKRERDAETDKKTAERKKRQIETRQAAQTNHNQSKTRRLRISVRPAEPATNEKAISLDMSALH